jgi:hypothetical protein
MGKNPVDPPLEAGALPLKEATSITMEEFTELMTGDPDLACFTFRGGIFP